MGFKLLQVNINSYSCAENNRDPALHKQELHVQKL